MLKYLLLLLNRTLFAGPATKRGQLLGSQMGGAKGVQQKAVYHITLGIEGGLYMMCEPRA
jgi:hypothetical protein